MINAASLLAKKSALKSVAQEVEAGVSEREQERKRIQEQNEQDIERIRAVTKLKTEEDRVQYYLGGGIDAWIDEMRDNLGDGQDGMNSVTFATSVVDFTKEEKTLIHSYIANVFRNEANVRQFGHTDLTSEACIHYVENVLKQDYFDFLEDKVATVRALVDADLKLDGLRERLDAVIRNLAEHRGAAFVKLTTRSPKDSFGALCAARRAVRRKVKEMEMADKEKLDMNALFIFFTEQVRLNMAVTSGHEAVHILADSIRVWEDLDTDIVESGSDKIQLVVRTFDKRITPSTEWRGFVWNKQFVAAGQYFYPFWFAHLNGYGTESSRKDAEDVRAEVKDALQHFYEKVMAPSIPEFLEHIPCFLMDLVYLGSCDSDSGSPKVMLTEINPFDGEAIGVFKGSTGLFSWDKEEDRRLMMGERPFELRVQEQKIITDGRKNQIDMANMSPLWVKAMYG